MAIEQYPYINDLPVQALMAPSVQAQLQSTYERGEAYALFDEELQEINPEIVFVPKIIAMKGLLVARAIIEQASASDFYTADDVDIACCHAWGSDVIQLGALQQASLTEQGGGLLLQVENNTIAGDIHRIDAGLSECGFAFPIRNATRYAFVPKDPGEEPVDIDK